MQTKEICPVRLLFSFINAYPPNPILHIVRISCHNFALHFKFFLFNPICTRINLYRKHVQKNSWNKLSSKINIIKLNKDKKEAINIDLYSKYKPKNIRNIKEETIKNKERQ